ncbi:hypothetical protein HanPI659440_Chr03g0098681 [Helianthus annuus]|nr:hypothetical protein HanPI659440_Chr03g0098681 [Helianthus annuus]
MASLPIFLCTLLIFLLSFNEISAVKYEVIVDKAGPKNTTDKTMGGIEKFHKVIGGVPYTQQIMGQINTFMWSTILKQNTPAERKSIDTIQVFITYFFGPEAITWGGNKINVSVYYLDMYEGPNTLKWGFTSLLYHEMTHVFQWNGEKKAPSNLLEGIVDYTILKANYAPPGFNKPGSGSRWDAGFDITARFLEYCDGLVPGFVAKLNNMMRKTYDVSFFKNITGKPVEQLWKDYKAKHPGVE